MRSTRSARLDAIRRDRRLAFPIEIDGGVTKENLGDVVRAGCDWIVTGSSIFHTPDPAAAVAELRQAATEATTVPLLGTSQAAPQAGDAIAILV